MDFSVLLYLSVYAFVWVDERPEQMQTGLRPLWVANTSVPCHFKTCQYFIHSKTVDWKSLSLVSLGLCTKFDALLIDCCVSAPPFSSNVLSSCFFVCILFKNEARVLIKSLSLFLSWSFWHAPLEKNDKLIFIHLLCCCFLWCVLIIFYFNDEFNNLVEFKCSVYSQMRFEHVAAKVAVV